MRVLLPLLLVLGACADPELQQRVEQLETEVAALKAAPKAPPAAARPTAARPVAAANPRNDEAIALFRAANQLVAANKYDEAKAKFNELNKDYGDTPAGKSGAKALVELNIIGKASQPLTVEKWYQGNTDIDSGKATLLVFWEVWCPHCKREVPKLQATHDKYGPKGLNVIGLTKQSKNITDTQVTDFVSSSNVTYPIAKEADGTASKYYGVSGIPAAAVLKDGKVVWRGHPGRITDAMIEGWL